MWPSQMAVSTSVMRSSDTSWVPSGPPFDDARECTPPSQHPRLRVLRAGVRCVFAEPAYLFGVQKVFDDGVGVAFALIQFELSIVAAVP